MVLSTFLFWALPSQFREGIWQRNTATFFPNYISLWNPLNRLGFAEEVPGHTTTNERTLVLHRGCAVSAAGWATASNEKESTGLKSSFHIPIWNTLCTTERQFCLGSYVTHFFFFPQFTCNFFVSVSFTIEDSDWYLADNLTQILWVNWKRAVKHFQHEQAAVFPMSSCSVFLGWIKVTVIITCQKGNFIQAWNI